MSERSLSESVEGTVRTHVVSRVLRRGLESQVLAARYMKAVAGKNQKKAQGCIDTNEESVHM